VWNALPATLGVLARVVGADDHTLETGAGASTVVFAALASRHTAVSPSADEHRRIVEYCQAHDIDTDGVTFLAAPSDEALPRLELDRPIDVAFIDGKHSFPHPVVDFHYVDRLLRPGGVLVIDDIPIPSVGVVYRYLLTSPDWELEEIVDDRAAVARKLATADWDDNWRLQPCNARYPSYSFAPWPRRIALHARDLKPAARRWLGERFPALRRLRGRR
jgi:predicted O-methyltransferase YrrM